MLKKKIKLFLFQVQLKEGDKQLTLWQKRLTTMKKLKAGFDSAGSKTINLNILYFAIYEQSELRRFSKKKIRFFLNFTKKKFIKEQQL